MYMYMYTQAGLSRRDRDTRVVPGPWFLSAKAEHFAYLLTVTAGSFTMNEPTHDIEWAHLQHSPDVQQPVDPIYCF